jgi:hypothetical protein
MIRTNILILLSYLALPYQVIGYPSQLTCGNLLTVGQSYMGNIAVSATNNIVVRRGATPLVSGSTYIPGETLTVTVDTNPGGSSAVYLFQASNAVYTSGACSGQNAYSGSGLSGTNTATLVLPNSGDVTVWGGYTTASSIPVNVLSNFVLKAPVLAIPSNAPVTNVPTATPRPTNLGEPYKRNFGETDVNQIFSDSCNFNSQLTAIIGTWYNTVLQQKYTFDYDNNYSIDGEVSKGFYEIISKTIILMSGIMCKYSFYGTNTIIIIDEQRNKVTLTKLN